MFHLKYKIYVNFQFKTFFFVPNISNSESEKLKKWKIKKIILSVNIDQ